MTSGQNEAKILKNCIPPFLVFWGAPFDRDKRLSGSCDCQRVIRYTQLSAYRHGTQKTGGLRHGIGSMLDQRRRRWSNIELTACRNIVFAHGQQTDADREDQTAS